MEHFTDFQDLVQLEDLGQGDLGCVEEVSFDSLQSQNMCAEWTSIYFLPAY